MMLLTHSLYDLWPCFQTSNWDTRSDLPEYAAVAYGEGSLKLCCPENSIIEDHPALGSEENVEERKLEWLQGSSVKRR